MSLDIFFSQHPVFRYEELVAYIKENHAFKSNTLKALLQYHLAKGHISRVRRGYYAVISPLKSRGAIANDPILIAGRITPDAIVAYHTALNFHAMAYSLFAITYFFAQVPIRVFKFEETSYQRATHHNALKPDDIFLETKIYDRQGLDIRVTNIERTLVDCIDKPRFAGGWEEIWRAADMVEIFDIDRLVNYALKLNNATTIAKTGFFLEQYQKQFDVKEEKLFLLEKHKPKSIHYMTKQKNACQYMKRWNLMVPTSIINKTWEEPNDDII